MTDVHTLRTDRMQYCCERIYVPSVRQRETLRYVPRRELPMPKPIREPALSGLGLLLMRLLNTELEVTIVLGRKQ